MAEGIDQALVVEALRAEAVTMMVDDSSESVLVHSSAQRLDSKMSSRAEEDQTLQEQREKLVFLDLRLKPCCAVDHVPVAVAADYDHVARAVDLDAAADVDAGTVAVDHGRFALAVDHDDIALAVEHDDVVLAVGGDVVAVGHGLVVLAEDHIGTAAAAAAVLGPKPTTEEVVVGQMVWE